MLLLQVLLVRAVLAEPPAAGDEARYQIDDQVLIHTRDGATLSATVVRRRDEPQRQPAILTLDIYTDPVAFRARGEEAADHGYVGVIADTRGKRLSPDPIEPYEHEAADAYEVIDWITHQSWSDGRVGMRGGSYSGFTAWAATKHLHPGLKTLAVSAAAIPGFGLSMANNVFLTANYGWAFYVADNRSLDQATYGDQARWEQLPGRWFRSGRPYREIDQLDGTANPLLQRWLRHPAFDDYWQSMVPYHQDFARIDIPVLTITGYYDDGQISALEYVRQHERYNPSAVDYLVVGPYDHFATGRATKPADLRGYATDPVAQFSTPELIYQWMDYVLRGGARPALLKDRVNYEVMGANEWRAAGSLQAMGAHQAKFYLSPLAASAGRHQLRQSPVAGGGLEATVDLADRSSERNTHQYPDPLIEPQLTHVTELVFESAPLPAPRVVSGSFTGELNVTLNKRDFDAGVTVFEQLRDGRLLHLAYWLGRASFARDPSARALLVPGKAARIAYRTSLISRRLEKGSRLVVLLDVNKSADAQVNYGTGKDVSDESIADAGEPLRVQFHPNSSFIVPWDP